jgi:hypothetical protein
MPFGSPYFPEHFEEVLALRAKAHRMRMHAVTLFGEVAANRLRAEADELEALAAKLDADEGDGRH